MLGKGYLFNKKLILRRHHDRNLSGRDSMRNMNLDALESQYLSDIKFLSRAGVIQNATSKKLLSWSKSYISNRKLLQSISNKEINFKKMILVFFARKDINLNTRISMLREYLRSNLPISVKLYKEMKQMFKN
jgi:hypothetical protein